MSTRWLKTPFPGVRYREHTTRKHGLKPDQYFSIYYRVDGRRKEEGLGWASQHWTAKKAASVLAELQEAARRGEGHVTLAEKRQAASETREAEREARAAAERAAMTFGQFFVDTYLPRSRESKGMQGALVPALRAAIRRDRRPHLELHRHGTGDHSDHGPEERQEQDSLHDRQGQ